MNIDTKALRKKSAAAGEGNIRTREEFLHVYSDPSSAAAFLRANISETEIPPVCFTLDGMDSRSLYWEKRTGPPREFVDYPNDNPVVRRVHTVTYTAPGTGLSRSMDVTEYPDYPVVEYEARLQNDGPENSGSIRDVRAVDTRILSAESAVLHSMTGATFRGVNQYVPSADPLGENGSCGRHFEAPNGKPTDNYLPYFNLENPAGGGVLAVLSWQGSWRADFTVRSGGVFLRGGQYDCDFVLLPGESFRVPMMIFLFYRGDWCDGQNVWRRFMLEHNNLRAQGLRMQSNTLICVGDDFEGMRGNARSDLHWIHMLTETGLNREIDHFNQDAGWYDCEETGWEATGNWYPNKKRYPNGLREVSDAARAAGMKYSLWFEPERAYSGTRITEELGRDCIVSMDAPRLHYIPLEQAEKGTQSLVNYGAPGVVDYVYSMLDRIICEQGVDQYRQDFNFYPAPFFRAFDREEAKKLGVARSGVTENKHTTGYLELWRRLAENHPDMEIDACASGGMRHDMATQRFSFTHTRSDYWHDADSAQCQTYSTSQWWVLTGCGAVLDGRGTYDVRSRLAVSIGVIVDESSPGRTKELLNMWRENAAYLLYDYYPLTTYSETQRAVLSMQFNSPEKECGSIFSFVRSAGSLRVYPRGLRRAARYRLWNIDAPDETCVRLGQHIMEHGITVSSKNRSAIIHRYAVECEDS